MRRQFYEPEVQPQQATPVRGFPITIGGVYVLLDDIITVTREYAQSLADADDAALMHEFATWLQSGEVPPTVTVDPAFADEILQAEHEQAVEQSVDRIEVYPDDPISPEPRWIARACNSDGDILEVTNGNFDQDAVIADAQARWPDVDVHLLSEGGIDTVWEERDPGGIRSSSSGRRRPSPKRLWASVG